MKGVEAVVFGVRHSEYLDLNSKKGIKSVGNVNKLHV